MIGFATLEMLKRNLCVGCYFGGAEEGHDEWEPLVDLVEEASDEQSNELPYTL